MSSGARMVRSPQPVLCFCACALWGFFWEGNVLAFLDAKPDLQGVLPEVQLPSTLLQSTFSL